MPTEKKPVVLTFLRHYLPGFKYGGPVRTLSNMTHCLGDDFEFKVVTLNRDMLETEPYPDVETNQWNRLGKCKVFYSSQKSISVQGFYQILRQTYHDVLYLNSLFDPLFTTLPLILEKSIYYNKKPIIIATRGELSEGALRLKWWKKKFFLTICKHFLYRNVTWHASTDDEANLIYKHISPSSRIIVAKNLPDSSNAPAKLPAKHSHQDQSLRIVYLSRIQKNKNLKFALEILLNCSLDIRFDIWGTIEDKSYFSDCMELIKSMPKNISVQYKGIADHTEVHQIMAQYDLFFLTTHGENFGHVILEALSTGTPVLISDLTPWRNLQAARVGWDLPLINQQPFLDALEAASIRIKNDQESWRKQVFSYAQNHLNDPQIIEANRQLFSRALNLKY